MVNTWNNLRKMILVEFGVHSEEKCSNTRTKYYNVIMMRVRAKNFCSVKSVIITYP